jgi:hypothetical protein
VQEVYLGFRTLLKACTRLEVQLKGWGNTGFLFLLQRYSIEEKAVKEVVKGNLIPTIPTG